MAGYRIFETKQFRNELDKLFSPYELKIINKKLTQKIYPQLQSEPHYGVPIKKLKNYDPESWRFRIGNFRPFYLIDEEKKMVVITALRRRKDAYR